MAQLICGGSAVSTQELIQVTLWFVLICTASVGFGKNALRILGKMLKVEDKQSWTLASTGVSLALGLSLLSYLSLILGLVGQFAKTNLVIMIVIMLISSIPTLIGGVRALKIRKIDWSAGVITLISMVMLATVYLSAMQPPHTTDELHYHFPQAQQIVNTERVDPKFGGHYFYGNIPKQMEVLYASAISISGPQLAHTMHFAFLVAFLLIVYGVISSIYTPYAAAWAVFMTLMHDELTWNMTSGFVDGAAFVMEIAGLLFVLQHKYGKNKLVLSLMFAGVTFGIGASIKYSVFVTAGFALLLLLPEIKRVWKYLLVPGLLLAGYWYFKNLIWFGNPFYPMYLGHPGVDSETYANLMAAIQEFGPKTWANFLSKMNHYKQISRLPTYIAFCTTPLLLFVSRRSRFQIPLVVFVGLYVSYWFLLGTHQLRFLAPAIIVSLILLGILLSRINKKILLVALTVLAIIMYKTAYFSQNVLAHFVDTKLHYYQRQYGLGNITEREFLSREFGCQYLAIKHLEDNEMEGNIIDNYSLWNAPSLGYYAKQNKLINLNFEYQDNLPILIKKHNLNYFFVDQKTKEKFLRNENPSVVELHGVAQAIESELSDDWESIYMSDTCTLYQLSK